MREQPTVPNRARPPRPEPRTVPQRVRPPVQPRAAAAPAARLEPTLRAPLPEPEAPRRAVPQARPMALPLLLPVLGVIWWAVGSAALGPGAGTLVLALGLAATVGAGIALRRRFGRGIALPAGGRTRVLRVVGASVAGILLGGAGLRLLGLGELAVPLAGAVVTFALFALVRLLDERILLGLAGALLVLAAIGAVTALSSAGVLYPQGLVGLGAGALCLSVAAIRGGLLAEARDRLRG